MALTIEDVKKVAHLARLQLTAAEVRQYQEQLSSVLDYVELLNELDLEDVPPTSHAVARRNVLREDEARPSLPVEDVLFNAPKKARDQFLIQAVLDDE
ncbi:MAG: Asp-tRNA(Asn)/Glu-tRNA(Gln) amidotransferase subunit GatC [Candidatus Promineifilaceae bacterium]|nr:Asp-tRNA(Asn)/Glu-tRNA(Gln) amidotransferase subunit GatC [Candidatus Promineifilaceae bacterium]